MANINIHYTHGQELPAVSAASLPMASVLRVNAFGGDSMSLFFENDEELVEFADRVNQAVTAYLQSKEDK